MGTESVVLVFDGVCNFCNGFVDFVSRRDPAVRVRLAAAQSSQGRRLLREKQTVYDALTLVEGDRVWKKSAAVLRLSWYLGFPWKIFFVFLLVPRFLRDFVYDWFARHRRAWFGVRKVCRAPRNGEEKRFL